MRSEWAYDVTALGGAAVYVAVAAIAFHVDIHFFAQLVVGFIFSYLFVFPFRMAFFRERPQKRDHANWLYKIDASSFPSHHVVRGVILWLLVANFFASAILWILAVVAAALIAYTRITLSHHHKSDSIAGLVLGAVAFLAILALDSQIAAAIM